MTSADQTKIALAVRLMNQAQALLMQVYDPIAPSSPTGRLSNLRTEVTRRFSGTVDTKQPCKHCGSIYGHTVTCQILNPLIG